MAATSAMGPVQRFFAVRAMPWAIVLVGVLGIWIGAGDWQSARESAAWPAVDGTITRSTVERVQSGGGGRPQSVTYAAQIAYAYAAEGGRHTGQRISFGHVDTEAPSDADAVVKRYPVGAKVKVHYMPGNPAESTLEPGAHGSPWLVLVLGALFACVGLLLVVVAPRIVARTA